MSYCSYYQALVSKSDTWFLVAVLRSFEHCVFDRTFDAQKAVVEFFVPQDTEDTFLEVMNYLQQQNVVFKFEKLPNRLKDPKAEV